MIRFWSGFNSTISDFRPSYAIVAYAPIVDVKPSDMTTVYMTMKKCLEMSASVGQENAIQTFDQQLYAVAQQVKWAMPNTFENHIIRLGGFHALSCFISAIGKLWSDGGLHDMLVDSGAYAGCTVDQMLTGKQFNRAVRGLTIVYEALMSLGLCFFFRWCQSNGHFDKIPMDFWISLKNCQDNFMQQLT